MEYYSTNDPERRDTLRQAVMRGVAPDAGLYMPRVVGRLPEAFFNNLADLSLHDIAYVVGHRFFHDDIPGRLIQRVVTEALSYPIPLVDTGGRTYSLELHHGPTMTVKDLGARFMARMLQAMGPGERFNVLVAASSDTAGAVAAGFHAVEGVRVYCVYPAGQLSRRMLAAFAGPGSNVTAISINADTDTCHRLVTSVLLDRDLAQRCRLLGANSINIARLLPQVIHHFHAWARLPRPQAQGRRLVVAVPAGNLSNLTAGVIAKRMGLPVSRFVAVSNGATALHSYLGGTTPGAGASPGSTLTPSMDIGEPSNLPRLLDLYGHSPADMARDIQSVALDDTLVADTMRRRLSERDTLLDPHSAAALCALQMSMRPGETGIWHATAAPAKHRRTVEEVTGVRLPRDHRDSPPAAAASPQGAPAPWRVAPNADALRRFVLTHIKP